MPITPAEIQAHRTTMTDAMARFNEQNALAAGLITQLSASDLANGTFPQQLLIPEVHMPGEALITLALGVLDKILTANQWRLDHLDPVAAAAEAARDSAPLSWVSDAVQALVKLLPKVS